MPTSFLILSLRPLGSLSTFHGRDAANESEWPPSPLRIFQALVDAAASRWREAQLLAYGKPALEWFQRLAPPEVVAPGHRDGTPIRIAVPNNDLDVWAGPVSKGNEPRKQPNELKTMKQIRPTYLSGEAIHCLYALPAEGCPHFDVLQAAARSVTHLGWGIDMVAGDARIITQEEADKLDGERWSPSEGTGGTPLRVPKAGTLDDLMSKHTAFLNRLSSGGFKPVPPLRQFDIVNYRRANEPEQRPYAAFRIASVNPDDPDERPPSFNTPRKSSHVAARLRHAVCVVVGKTWPDKASFVHGHDPNDSTRQLRGEAADHRLMYLPLPSIEKRGERGEVVGDVRRVLVAAPLQCAGRIDWLRQRLPGELLVHSGEQPVMLLPLRSDDWVLKQYVGESHVWTTVTPMIWPWHDDGDPAKAESLLRRAFVQAGVRQEIEDCGLEWGGFGYRRGVEPAARFERPDKLAGRRCHVRVRFKSPVRGPLAIGAGRYRGMGVMCIA
jgi:CRISPR-associated protein Csb2